MSFYVTLILTTSQIAIIHFLINIFSRVFRLGLSLFFFDLQLQNMVFDAKVYLNIKDFIYIQNSRCFFT
jgi:hypothetical protein